MLLALLSVLAWGQAPAATPIPLISTDADIRVDGRLDEPAWASATPITTFERYQPTNGPAPVGTTEVRLLQDGQNLLIGVRVRGVDYRVRARVSQRERIQADDQIGVYLDTFHDQRTGYVFYFNPLGIQQDIRAAPNGWSFAWDTVLRSKGRVVEGGYDLEIAIPFRSLKFPAGDAAQTWGLLLTRKIPTKGEKYAFPHREDGHPFLFSQAAELQGVRPARRSSGVEIIPALTVGQSGTRTDPAQPLDWTGLDPWYEAIHPSLDMKLGITANTSLAVTAFPDFSQIEADDFIIDLNQRFTPDLRERRPFFLDGFDYFEDREETLYTRSIVQPLWGAKMSGKEGPYGFGVLHALDMAPAPTVHDSSAPTKGFTAADVDGAWALNTLARFRVDAFGKGYIGLTAADKRVVKSGFGELHGVHNAVGADLQVPLGGRWTVAADTLQSFTGDGGGDSMWGQRVGAEIKRASGKGTGFELKVDDTTPGHRKEMGFLTQAGLTQAEASLDHTFASTGAINMVRPGLEVATLVERSGEFSTWGMAEYEMRFHGVHTLELDGGGSVRRVDTSIGERRDVGGWWANEEYEADLSGGVTVSQGAGAFRSWDWRYEVPAQFAYAKVGTVLRPIAGIRVDASFQINHKAPALADGSFDPEWSTRTWGRVQWQFTSTLGTRVIVEHTDGTALKAKLRTSALFTWLLHPGTAAYIGYTETTNLQGTVAALDRTIFAKASVLFRP